MEAVLRDDERKLCSDLEKSFLLCRVVPLQPSCSIACMLRIDDDEQAGSCGAGWRDPHVS